jgi:methylglyoxal synthase
LSAGGDRPVVALVAHDDKKAALAAWAQRHGDVLRGCILYATGTTGGRVLDAVAGLDLTRLKSGPLGGDQQIGALIAEGRIDALIFFVDPLSPHPHDVDVKALMRVALVYDIPMALSESTAELIIAALAARVQGAGPAERGRSMSTNS